MNLIKYISVILIFLLTQVNAVDISAQIAQLKNAKKSEKYMIMNKIKMQIAQLNSAQRAKAISQLRGAMSGSTGNNMQAPKTTIPSMPVSVPDMPQMPIPPVPMISATMQVPKGGK